MHLSDGTKFYQPTPGVIPTWNGTDLYNSLSFGVMVWFGDFNGDGKTDAMAWDETTDSGYKGRQMIMHISTCDGFCADGGFRKETWRSA
jgi:hypothetical protein